MKIDGESLDVKHLFVSPGHDFRGRHNQDRDENGVVDCEEVELVAGSGIVGDRYFNHKEDFKGQITFFDEAVWLAVKKEFALPELDASDFRRNIIVSGVDLNSLIGQQFTIGELGFSGSEEASPCYWMDKVCAPGVEEFLRGRGGLRCRILRGGILKKGPSELRVIRPV